MRNYIEGLRRPCGIMKSPGVIVLLIVLFLAGPVSAQQQDFDYSQVTRLRWMGSEPPDTYTEYLATHPPRPIQIVPLRMAPMQIPLDDGAPRVLVIVNSALQPFIQTNLDRYVTDIQAAGYAADLYISTPGTAESLKDFIISQSTDLLGCVLLGDLPCAWYEIEDDYDEYGYASFPCDLYLMDLDGTWEDLETTDPMQSGVYDNHADGSGDTAPEIFVGRIDASQMTGDAQHVQINDYLDKLHAWYSSQLKLTNYALTYTEDDWVQYHEFWADIASAFPSNEAIKAPDTNRDDYRDNRLTSPIYQFIQLSCHSWAGGHAFTRGGNLYSSVIKAVPPKALFYNLFCCSASRFTYEDFLGGAYIFNPSTTSLATIGSTKTGAMLYFRHFYEPLGEGKTLGQAFSDWFNAITPYSPEKISWHYGMTIIGDPLIVPVASDPSDIILLRPNGGEHLLPGDECEIAWWTQDTKPDSISILLSLDSGETYPDTIASGLPGTDTAYLWTVDDLPISLGKIKVEAWYGGAVEDYDVSDFAFVIRGGPYRYVSTTGGNIPPYSMPAWAALSIQDAIDYAADGDSIFIETGTYNEKISVRKPVHILGGWDVGFTTRDADLYPSTINSNGSTVSFSAIPGTGCGIEGCVIIGGTGNYGQLPELGFFGGGILSCDASPLIKDNTIVSCGYVSNSTYSAGGGIACYLGSPEIVGNSIVDCAAQSGGGIYLYQATATISGNKITGAHPDPVYSGNKNGGGLCALNSTVTMSGNSISGSSGYNNGGGIYSWLGAVSINGDSITANGTVANGAGIMTVRSSLFCAGAVISGNSGAIGGGVYHKAAQFDMANSLVALNAASTIAGGIYADSCWGTIENNTIDGNSGVYGIGNFFLGNSQGCEITSNHITFGSPTGFLASPDVNISYTYNNAFGSPGEDVITLVPDGTNISADPLYANTLNGDYHHTLLSPGIDAGSPAAGTDPDGSRADIGMFGGPGAEMTHPWFVQNCAASALNDTTIRVYWDELFSFGLANYAVFGDTAVDFTPGASHLLGTTLSVLTQFDHSPVEGCWYYKVCAVNVSTYSGGYSNEAGDCIGGGDILSPIVTVTSPASEETFMAGDSLLIEWIATDENDVDSVAISYSLNAGSDFTLLSSGEPNDSAYVWVIPVDIPGSDSCVVRVEAWDPSENTGSDYSGGYFTILDYVTGTGDTPTATALMQNYPNPFNGHTMVTYSLDKPGHVSVRIYDTAGRLVRTLVDRDQGAGTWQVGWNGRDDRARPVTSGIYFMRMVAGDYNASRKIVYLR